MNHPSLDAGSQLITHCPATFIVTAGPAQFLHQHVLFLQIPTSAVSCESMKQGIISKVSIKCDVFSTIFFQAVCFYQHPGPSYSSFFKASHSVEYLSTRRPLNEEPRVGTLQGEVLRLGCEF